MHIYNPVIRELLSFNSTFDPNLCTVRTSACEDDCPRKIMWSSRFTLLNGLYRRSYVSFRRRVELTLTSNDQYAPAGSGSVGHLGFHILIYSVNHVLSSSPPFDKRYSRQLVTHAERRFDANSHAVLQDGSHNVYQNASPTAVPQHLMLCSYCR